MTVFASIFRAAAVAVMFASAASAQDRQAAATLVLYNTSDPDSVELAQYYAAKRGIPQAQVVGLDTPSTEEISRMDFNRTIASPLRKKLVSQGWWKMRNGSNGDQLVSDSSIRFVAIMRGIPLKVASDASIGNATHVKGVPIAIASRNDASVDGEIAALGLEDFTPAGLMPNPYFGRFTPIMDETVTPGLLLPSRLDAPTAAMVRAMIDDALMVEKEGLWGWAYVDGRNITDGGYAEGDGWMRNLVEMLRQRGVPVIYDDYPQTISDDFPVTEAALYYGWYAGDLNGPFAREGFTFNPGAIAVHLHSYSAATLRSTTTNWCGPLIAHGAAATLGNVYEPYLSLTANLDVFQDRLMTGLTLAESGYMSLRALSWMAVVVGDPLYKPYKAWSSFSDPRQPANPYRMLRGITANARSNILNAILPIHEAARETGDSMFLEALGAAQADAGQPAAAVKTFQSALAFASDGAVRRRLEMEIEASTRRMPLEERYPIKVAEKEPEPQPEPGGVQTLPEGFSTEGTDSPLVKPAAVVPPMPEEIPNLPYPDL
jgi:uncharacterized protein (TIGR03790 family)